MIKSHLLEIGILSVRPGEKFIAWAKSLPDSLPHEEEYLRNDTKTPFIVYLPELLDEKSIEKLLKTHYKAIFTHQLRHWASDESIWPKDQSFKAFKQFFRVEVIDEVVDLLPKTATNMP